MTGSDAPISSVSSATEVRPRGRRSLVAVVAVVGLLSVMGPAAAQSASGSGFDFGGLASGNGAVSGRILQLVALLTVLSVAPGLLIMCTSFTRFVIAFSFLRSGLGLQSTPANLILISLSLFMTFYVMSPTLDKAWIDGVQPLVKNEIGEEQAFERVTAPFRTFMQDHVRTKDLQLFEKLAVENLAQAPRRSVEDPVDFRTLIPAFMISELRRGFEMGFLIALPFLVIDMIAATITMSMGMMMLPPTVLSIPFKVLFFVLTDSWNLLVGGMVRSFT
jgi:flagellar biosynthetic protein FliP